MVPNLMITFYIGLCARPLILGQEEVPEYEQGCSAATNTACRAGTSMVSRMQAEISQ